MGALDRRTAPWAVVIVAAALLVSGCHAATPTSNPGAGPTGVATATAGPTGADSSGPGGGAGASTTTNGSGAAGGALTFASLWSRRAQLVGEAVTVDGTVLFALQCPPAGGSSSCVATAYLADGGLGSLPAQPADVALLLYDRGKAIGCVASSVTGLSCSGWQHGARYRLLGVIRHQVASGRELPNLVFDATSRTAG
jgi:hypothetical protein